MKLYQIPIHTVRSVSNMTSEVLKHKHS